jgi:tRNA pseudouridine55 synthase
MSDPFGLLNIYKPAGKTSRWVVDQVQRLVRPAKAGHAGTLDPLATGVLIVAIGPATRLIEYIQQMPKHYRAEFRLGCISPTEDVDGEVSELDDPLVPSLAEIESALPEFRGTILQVPPAFSALKIAGRRAYALARAGEAVDLKPRVISIHQLNVLSYDYPKLELEIKCGSGTYVRSLGRDLAQRLGTGAVMAALERTAIGEFRVDTAIDVMVLSADNLEAYQLPPRRAVDHLPTLNIDRAAQLRLARGQSIAPPQHAGGDSELEFAAIDDCGNLAAIVRRHADGLLWPLRNFAEA